MSKLTLAVLGTGALANGIATNSVQATVTDDTGVATSGVAVSFTTTAGVFDTPASATDANGQVTASLTGTTAGDVTVTASLADGTVATAVVTFAAVVAPVTAAADVAPTAVEPASVDNSVATAVVATSALAEFKAKAEAEIEKFAKFVEHGIEVLGADAEAELVALKDKYL